MATPDELAPFVLRDVRGLDSGEKKGSGAYGAVYEVSVKGVSCIAKRIHDILVNQEVSRRERESIQQKFRQECVILSKLKHPNVVYFVGVHYGRAPGDLSLVMEKLHTDLAKCLDGAAETQQDIPLSIKLSILLDVSGGLLYLHTLPQAIIHRDLSAGNILLTRHMQAKIADLGVSKLIDLRKAKVHTRAPGTSDYMPPEALQKKPVYDTKLDVFSFGHLMLYTILQELPEVYENVTPEALRRGTAQILKRETSIDKMGKDHVLYPLNIQCLQDKPERRPTTLELNQAVMELSNKHPIDLMGGFHKDDTDVRVLKKVLSESDHKRQELSQELHKMKEKCDQLRQLYHESEQRHVYMLAVNEKLKAQAEQVECMTMEISHSESRVSAQSKEIAALKEQIGKKDDEIAALNAQAQAYLEDFEHERKDRQEEASKMKRLQEEYRQVVAQQKETQIQLDESHQRLEKNIADTAKLHDEVLAKTQQVKQYKKQADNYKAKLEQNRAGIGQYQSQLEEFRLHAQQREEEVTRLRQQLEEQSVNRQQVQKRHDDVLAQLQGMRSQRFEFWKVSPEDVVVLPGEEHVIGRGAWGYVAKGTFRGQRVAVKYLHQAIRDPRTVERVNREICTMAQVRHPNLVLFLAAVYEQGSPPMIVTELLDVDLRTAYETGRLQGSSKLVIFRDVACALNYLHQHREAIIHRDVSAPNVLLEALAGGVWKAKVSDFGSANLARYSKTLAEGAIVYAAPETYPQRPGARPLPQTTKIDVYSYGVLLCEVIIGEIPEPEQLRVKTQDVRKQWLSIYNLIDSCIQWEATDRPTMAKILTDLPQPLPRMHSSS